VTILKSLLIDCNIQILR